MTDENMIVEVAQDLLEFFGKGVLRIEDVRSVAAVFLMGAHEARTALAAARLLSKELSGARVVISGGGDGRGSAFLTAAIDAHSRAHGRERLLADDVRCEATLLKRLLVDEDIQEQRMSLEMKARHTRENWLLSFPLLEELRIGSGALIGVVQSPLNRARALHTGRHVRRKEPVFHAYALSPAQIVTIDFSRPDLTQLSERERVIELFRMFGLPPHTQSEVKVCEQYCASVTDGMPLRLLRRAQDAEEHFHTLMRERPDYHAYIQPALATMAAEVSGVR